MNSFHLITEIRRSFILEYLATPFDSNHSLTRETKLIIIEYRNRIYIHQALY